MQTGSSSEPILDLAHALKAMDGDRQGLVEIIEAFLDGSDDMRASIRPDALTSAALFSAACHELGTSFGIVGARRGERLARSLEQALRRGEPVDLPLAAHTLAKELDLVISMLMSEHRWESHDRRA